MITQLDDYNVHQTPEPLSRPASSDRNVYDRHFLSGFDAGGAFLFEAALGLYPNRDVIDAHFNLLVDGVQHCFHASARAPRERTEMRVGPFELEIERPLRVLRLRLHDNASGLRCDLRFTARSAAAEEPRSLLHDGDRLVMHTTRYVQFGRWQGEITVDGRTLAVDGARGLRDRSWGIRPCGEPAGGAPPREPRDIAVYWAWVPLDFDDCCTQFNTFEDRAGRPTQLGAGIMPAYAQPDSIPAQEAERDLPGARLAVRWRPGTRHPQGGVIAWDGGCIELEPLATLLTKGLGYHHPEWGHGLWKGELAIGHERLRLAELDPLRHDHVHVHQLVRARMTGDPGAGVPSGGRVGVGLLETLCFGPHAPSGFAGFLDGFGLGGGDDR